MYQLKNNFKNFSRKGNLTLVPRAIMVSLCSSTYSVSLVSSFLNLHCEQFVCTSRNACRSVLSSHVPHPKKISIFFSVACESSSTLCFFWLLIVCKHGYMYVARKNSYEETYNVALSEKNKISETLLYFLHKRLSVVYLRSIWHIVIF